MRKLHLLVFSAVMGLTTRAIAQDEPASPPEGGASPETPAEESSVNTANEPVKEAAADVHQKMGMRPDDANYGSAGCGLGSLLFEPSNGFTQVFAATTNGTSGTQTFGITSGTSNCDGSGYHAGSAQAFVETNRAALAKDIARGKGATIAALTEVAGCSNSRAVGRTLKKQFKAIFPGHAATDQHVSSSVVEVLKSESTLACTNLT